MRSGFTVLALVLAAATPAHAQEGDGRIRVIAPARSSTFVSLTWDGLVRRHEASGAVVETLGRATPYDGHSAAERVQAAAEGAFVASTDLVRVAAGSSTVMISQAQLRAERCDHVVDFAFDAQGRRGVLIAGCGAEHDVVFAIEDHSLRRLTTIPAVPRAHIAIDPSARWVAVMLDSFGRLSSSPAGPLLVLDWASGRQLWTIERCDPPLYGDALHFFDAMLVACRRGQDPDSRGTGVAAYDAASGRVRWARTIGTVYARTSDGGTLLVDHPAGGPVQRIDVVNGRERSIGASWSGAPYHGLLLDRARVVFVERNPRQSDLVSVELSRAPWARPE